MSDNLRAYQTQNTLYKVQGIDPNGREIILWEAGGGHPYAVVGFADPEKLGSNVWSGDRYWFLKEGRVPLHRGEGEGSLEKALEKEPRPGLQVVGWLTDGEGNFLGPREGVPDEIATSRIKEIKEAA